MITPERVKELRVRAADGLKNASEYHDIFLEGVVKDSWKARVDFWTDLLSLLDEKAEQIKAGGATGFGKTNAPESYVGPVSKNLTPAESPVLSEAYELEKARELINCGKEFVIPKDRERKGEGKK